MSSSMAVGSSTEVSLEGVAGALTANLAVEQSQLGKMQGRSLAGVALGLPDSPTHSAARAFQRAVSGGGGEGMENPASISVRANGDLRTIQKSYWSQGIWNGVYYLFQYIFRIDSGKRKVIDEIYAAVQTAVKSGQVVDIDTLAATLLEKTNGDTAVIFKLMTENSDMVQHAFGYTMQPEELVICLHAQFTFEGSDDSKRTLAQLLLRFPLLNIDNFSAFTLFVRDNKVDLKRVIESHDKHYPSTMKDILGEEYYLKLLAVLGLIEPYNEQTVRAVQKIIAHFELATAADLAPDAISQFFMAFEREVGGKGWVVPAGKGPGRIIGEAVLNGYDAILAYGNKASRKQLEPELIYWTAVANQPNLSSAWSDREMHLYIDCLKTRFTAEAIIASINARQDDFDGMYGGPNTQQFLTHLRQSEVN